MRSRPAGNGTATKLERALTPQYAMTGDLATLAAKSSYAIRCVQTLRTGQTRTQVYSNLPAAIRAVERARARGCEAVLSLVRIVPVGIVTDDELDVLRRDSR